MIDKKLEANIKKTKDFIEIWGKFQRIFKMATSGDHVNANKEQEFLSTKYLVNSRYEDLMDSVGMKPLRRFIISPSIYNVLALDKLSMMSDERSKAIAKDWEESSRFLNSLLNRLERKKRRIEGFNKFVFVLKNRIRRKR